MRCTLSIDALLASIGSIAFGTIAMVWHACGHGEAVGATTCTMPQCCTHTTCHYLPYSMRVATTYRRAWAWPLDALDVACGTRGTCRHYMGWQTIGLL